jgi:ABC-2 type transport system permease protein
MSTNVTQEAPAPPQPRIGPETELAPSVMAKDDPVAARIIGMVAAALVIFGGAVLLMARSGRQAAVGSGWATISLTLGISGLLFHAAYDTDVQFRRLYMVFGYVAIGVGVLLCFIGQFGTGVLLFALAVCFLLAFLRNETDPSLRDACHLVLAVAGGLFALIGLAGGWLYPDFLWPVSQPVTELNQVQPLAWPRGLFLGFVGLIYLAACVGSRGISDDKAYRLGLAMGLFGVVVFLFALFKSLFPGWFTRSVNPTPFLLPAGFLLMFLAVLYILVSLGMTSDLPVVVLTRRELEAFFYSPIAYMVLFGFTLAHWWTYIGGVHQLQNEVLEPIVRIFAFQISSIFFIVFAVPALTMRLLSEEQRTGTLEVTLTSPVDEASVVLSKFFAAYLIYLIMWVPFVLFMVALRVGGGREFDYRPLISFGIAVAVTGAGFIAMGVFCSSLSRNQIISAVLAFLGMLMLTLVFIIKIYFRAVGPGKTGSEPGLMEAILDHISYIDLWNNALEGKLVLRTLLFPLSMAVFFLFLTIKVLEARKWK